MLLKIGEPVSVPPAGFKKLKLDADGAPMLVTPAGSSTTLSPWVEVAVPSDVQDVTIATGLNGDLDLGYEIEGDLAALAGNENLFLRPNNSDANCEAIGFSSTGAAVSFVSQTTFFLIDGSVGQTPHFRCRLDSNSARTRFFQSTAARGPRTGGFCIVLTGQYAVAAGAITSLVLHGDTADSIKAGSVLRWRRV